MNENTKIAILNFAKKKLGRDDLDLSIEITEDKRSYLVLTVDCMKMDKNSGRFDKSYHDFVNNEHFEKPRMLLLLHDSTVLSPIINDFRKFMDIEIKSWFQYKNYDYIDDIEAKIESAIKKSSYPNVEIGFSGSGEKPKLSLIFYNVPSEFMNDYKKGEELHEKYIEELNNLTGLDLNQYSIGRTIGDKNN